jgi:hypothetical protein
MRVSIAVCFAAMILGAVAHAESPGAYTIGIGNYSCGRFIAAIGKNAPGKIRSIPTGDGDFVSEIAEYQQWLLGFVSGFNSAIAAYNAAHADEHEQQVTRFDPAGMDLWMRNWCNKHPTNLVYDGAVAFVDEMRINAAASGANRQ